MNISELKAQLALLDNEIKALTPIKRVIIKAPVVNQYAADNALSATYTGTKAIISDTNKRIKQDIAIQQDILSFIQNGGIIKSYTSNKLNGKAVNGAKAGLSLYKKFAV